MVQEVVGRLGPFTETGRTKLLQMNMEASEETIVNELKAMLLPKIILVNHEKELSVDVPLANLGLKYNFMYVSVHQLIRQHILGNTEWGIKLLKSRIHRQTIIDPAVKDEFEEAEYTAVHYDQHLVLELIKHTVQNYREPA